MRTVVWFSCGAASAVAAKLAVEKYGDACEVVYCDTMATEHPDNRRFFDDVQTWLGRPITVIRSEKYANIDDVFERVRYMSGVKGARCTTELKKIPREVYQRESDTHIFGYSEGEEKRAEDFEKRNPDLHVEWILIDSGVDKDMCFRLLEDAGIRLPEMYALGFDHNNCIGCPKATSPGYWNRVRRLFPGVFEKRARQSRVIGAKLVRIRNVRRYLDELPLDEDAPDDNIECGPVCQTPEEVDESDEAAGAEANTSEVRQEGSGAVAAEETDHHPRGHERDRIRVPEVTLARPFMKFVGGKTSLLPELLKHIPSSYGTYYEPFVGGGALFFALDPRPSKAVLSDANERLIRTYRAIRDDVDAVVLELKAFAECHSKDFFLKQRKRDIDVEDDVSVAGWMIYLTKTCFNGLYRVNQSGGFNTPFGKYNKPNICDEGNLRACSAALQGVEILCQDFRTTISSVRAGDFCYFDSPYVPLSDTSNFTSYTKAGFGPKDQQDLATLARHLKTVGVHILLSNSSADEVPALYAQGFTLETVMVKRAINSKGTKRGAVREFLIR